MLDEFIAAHRTAIIERTRARVAERTSPRASEAELIHGIPVFLDQLGEAIRLARSSELDDHTKIGESAAKHGCDLLRRGLTIAQVVHDYGDVCQVITGLALEQNEPISRHEFRTLNLCLDDAIAGAVTEYARHRERAIESVGTERLGVFAHEMRNLVTAATLAFDIIRKGVVAPGGSTGMLLGNNLTGLRDLIDRSLANVRLEAGVERFERISVAEFLEEIEIGALVQAQACGMTVAITSVDPAVTIEGDRQILAGALSNLLQNGFKFSRKHGHVTLTARTSEGRVLFKVEDECGGLPPGKAEELFRPSEPRDADPAGVGLGLAIGRRAAEAHGGELRVRDVPGKGCVFTLDLPRVAPLPPTLVGKKKPDGAPPGGADAQDALAPATVPRKTWSS